MIDYSFPLEELEYYLFILVRVSLFVFVAPFFGETSFPRYVKVALSCFIAFVLYGAITPHVYPQYTTIIEFAIVVLKEAICGLLLGLGAMFCSMIVSFAGTLIDTEIGLGMAQLMDPTTRMNQSLTGVMYRYAFSLILITSGMYRYLLGAICDSFKLIPVGEQHFAITGLYKGMLEFMTNFIIIGFRIALPVFCTILLLNGILGIMAKVSPQMNMFAVGMQLKILTGLAVMFLTVGLLPNAADFIFTQMKIMTVTFIKAAGGS